MRRLSIPNWQEFVLQHGWRVPNEYMAHLLKVDVQEILRVKTAVGAAMVKREQAEEWPALFAAWHGRPPGEDDWPVPIKQGQNYEWLGNELALLAALVGQIGAHEIARVLTERLRQITGDARATRTRTAVTIAANLKLGLAVSDVVGGLTVRQAAKQVKSISLVHQLIDRQVIETHRVGRLYVIHRESWEKWKSSRTFPPRGYVQLSSIRESLGINSDSKLPEFAACGYVPTAIRCNPYGTGSGTQFGTWYISAATARKLVADRRAGKPMPWHGKPLLTNLRVTFRLWQERKHPHDCPTCQQIWGDEGAPQDFDAYMKRYPALEHGAKRHLTLPWSPGLTIAQVVDKSARTQTQVLQAIHAGVLTAWTYRGTHYVTQTDYTLWKARRFPLGEGEASWIALETACKQYLFTEAELRQLIREGKLATKVGTNGPMRGVTYVSKNQCRIIRERDGFSLEEAARRLKLSLPRFRTLLEGVRWRQADRIPLATVQAVRKRLESRQGFEVNEAAEVLDTTVQWVEERIKDGTVRISQAPWDRRRRYLSVPMIERLRLALAGKGRPRLEPIDRDGTFSLGQAAVHAGVSTATISRWAEAGLVHRTPSRVGDRYDKASVAAQARVYWINPKFKRMEPPLWLQRERAHAGAEKIAVEQPAHA